MKTSPRSVGTYKQSSFWIKHIELQSQLVNSVQIWRNKWYDLSFFNSIFKLSSKKTLHFKNYEELCFLPINVDTTLDGLILWDKLYFTMC